MRRTFIGLIAACAALALPATAAEQINLSIATGGTGGVYYPLGGGMANVLSKYVPGMAATAEVTGGSVDNLKLIATGKPYIALAMADASQDAMQGEGKFKGAKVPLRTLMILYTNIMHIVVPADSSIKSVKDMKGKRLSTGSPGSATEVMAFRVLEAAGIDPMKDITRERLGASESANALKDKKIDGFFFVVGPPTSAITDLAATPGINIRFIDHADLVPAMNKKYDNLYAQDVLRKGTYPNMTVDNKVSAVANILVAHEKMSEQTAYTIVKTIFDKQPELVAVHKAAADIKLESQKASSSPILFHPGAIKFFKEKGVSLK
jgi:TRAP transporter TAXI family solute receptor